MIVVRRKTILLPMAAARVRRTACLTFYPDGLEHCVRVLSDFVWGADDCRDDFWLRLVKDPAHEKFVRAALNSSSQASIVPPPGRRLL